MFGPPAPPFIDAPLAPTGDGTLADPVDLTHLGPSPPHTGPPVDGGAIDDDDEEAQLRRALAQSIEDNATATGGSRSPVPGTAGEANGLVPTGQNAVTLPGYSVSLLLNPFPSACQIVGPETDDFLALCAPPPSSS